MSWSLNIGSVAGTAVRIHVTFLLFLAWIFGVNYFSTGPQAAWNGLLFIVLLFLCVLLHEFGHIFTARSFGVRTPDVILLPIGGVARLERIPEKPSEEFLIAIAGPAVNVVIALLLVFIGGASLSTEHLSALENGNVSMIDRLAAVNLFLALFNLIPAFPMDGGRVLRALLASRLGYVHATEIAATVGQAVAFMLGFLGLFGNPLLIFIAIFVYLAAACGSASGGDPRHVAGRAGDCRDADAVCDTDARRARGCSGADAAAHQSGRVSSGGRPRQAGRRADAKRPHSRAKGTRPRCAGGRRHDHEHSDRQQKSLPRRGVSFAPGKVGASGRRGRRVRNAWSDSSRPRPSAKC